MTPSCDDHEIEIEMRAAGALDPADTTRLETHLAGCADCRAYLSRKRQQDDALAARAASEATIDWTRIRGKVERTVESYRRGVVQWLLFLPITFLATLGLTTLAGMPVSPLLLAVGFGGMTVMTAWLQRRKLAQLRALAAQSDVIGAWRSNCNANLRVWRMIRVFAPMAVLGFALQLPNGGRSALVIGGFNAVMGTLVFINGLRLARTARRELAELH